jgi:hypothetical protein
VCCICGTTRTVFDGDLEEAGMVGSNYGVYCEKHLLQPLDKILKEMWDNAKDSVATECSYSECDLLDLEEDYKDEYRSEIPSEYCPLYNLKHISKGTLLKYFLKKNNYGDENQLIAEIQEKFENLDQVEKYCGVK